MRRHTGSIFKRRGSLWARVKFIDPVTGKHRDLHRAAQTRSEACDLRDRLLLEIEETGGHSVRFERATLAELAESYELTYLIEPQHVDGRNGGRSAIMEESA